MSAIWARRTNHWVIRMSATIAMALSLSGCQRTDSRAFVPSVDLIDLLGRADRRPEAVRFLQPMTIAGETLRAIETPPMSRVTWHIRLVDRALLRVSLAVKPAAWSTLSNGADFRIGISHERTYQELFVRHVDPLNHADDRRWIPVTLDLSAYSGFKWSLFYQPRRWTWNVIFNTRAVMSGSESVPLLWGEPTICRPAPAS
jgi:hypothetical protein